MAAKDRFYFIVIILGNTWGRDESGRGCMGCGHQETFVNCADVSIRGWTTDPQPPKTTKPNNVTSKKVESTTEPTNLDDGKAIIDIKAKIPRPPADNNLAATSIKKHRPKIPPPPVEYSAASHEQNKPNSIPAPPPEHRHNKTSKLHDGPPKIPAPPPEHQRNRTWKAYDSPHKIPAPPPEHHHNRTSELNNSLPKLPAPPTEQHLNRTTKSFDNPSKIPTPPNTDNFVNFTDPSHNKSHVPALESAQNKDKDNKTNSIHVVKTTSTISKRVPKGMMSDSQMVKQLQDKITKFAMKSSETTREKLSRFTDAPMFVYNSLTGELKPLNKDLKARMTNIHVNQQQKLIKPNNKKQVLAPKPKTVDSSTTLPSGKESVKATTNSPLPLQNKIDLSHAGKPTSIEPIKDPVNKSQLISNNLIGKHRDKSKVSPPKNTIESALPSGVYSQIFGLIDKLFHAKYPDMNFSKPPALNTETAHKKETTISTHNMSHKTETIVTHTNRQSDLKTQHPVRNTVSNNIAESTVGNTVHETISPYQHKHIEPIQISSDIAHKLQHTSAKNREITTAINEMDSAHSHHMPPHKHHIDSSKAILKNKVGSFHVLSKGPTSAYDILPVEQERLESNQTRPKQRLNPSLLQATQNRPTFVPESSAKKPKLPTKQRLTNHLKMARDNHITIGGLKIERKKHKQSDQSKLLRDIPPGTQEQTESKRQIHFKRNAPKPIQTTQDMSAIIQEKSINKNTDSLHTHLQRSKETPIISHTMQEKLVSESKDSHMHLHPQEFQKSDTISPIVNKKMVNRNRDTSIHRHAQQSHKSDTITPIIIKKMVNRGRDTSINTYAQHSQKSNTISQVINKKMVNKDRDTFIPRHAQHSHKSDTISPIINKKMVNRGRDTAIHTHAQQSHVANKHTPIIHEHVVSGSKDSFVHAHHPKLQEKHEYPQTLQERVVNGERDSSGHTYPRQPHKTQSIKPVRNNGLGNRGEDYSVHSHSHQSQEAKEQLPIIHKSAISGSTDSSLHSHPHVFQTTSNISSEIQNGPVNKRMPSSLLTHSKPSKLSALDRAALFLGMSVMGSAPTAGINNQMADVKVVNVNPTEPPVQVNKDNLQKTGVEIPKDTELQSSPVGISYETFISNDQNSYKSKQDTANDSSLKQKAVAMKTTKVHYNYNMPDTFKTQNKTPSRAHVSLKNENHQFLQSFDNKRNDHTMQTETFSATDMPKTQSETGSFDNLHNKGIQNNVQKDKSHQTEPHNKQTDPLPGQFIKDTESGWGAPLSSTAILAQPETLSNLYRAQEMVNQAHNEAVMQPERQDVYPVHSSGLLNRTTGGTLLDKQSKSHFKSNIHPVQNKQNTAKTIKPLIPEHSAPAVSTHKTVDTVISSTNKNKKITDINIENMNANLMDPVDIQSTYTINKTANTRLIESLNDLTQAFDATHFQDKFNDQKTTSGHLYLKLPNKTNVLDSVSQNTRQHRPGDSAHKNKGTRTTNDNKISPNKVSPTITRETKTQSRHHISSGPKSIKSDTLAKSPKVQNTFLQSSLLNKQPSNHHHHRTFNIGSGNKHDTNADVKQDTDMDTQPLVDIRRESSGQPIVTSSSLHDTSKHNSFLENANKDQTGNFDGLALVDKPLLPVEDISLHAPPTQQYDYKDKSAQYMNILGEQSSRNHKDNAISLPKESMRINNNTIGNMLQKSLTEKTILHNLTTLSPPKLYSKSINETPRNINQRMSGKHSIVWTKLDQTQDDKVQNVVDHHVQSSLKAKVVNRNTDTMKQAQATTTERYNVQAILHHQSHNIIGSNTSPIEPTSKIETPQYKTRTQYKEAIDSQNLPNTKQRTNDIYYIKDVDLQANQLLDSRKTGVLDHKTHILARKPSHDSLAKDRIHKNHNHKITDTPNLHTSRMNILLKTSNNLDDANVNKTVTRISDSVEKATPQTAISESSIKQHGSHGKLFNHHEHHTATHTKHGHSPLHKHEQKQTNKNFDPILHSGNHPQTMLTKLRRENVSSSHQHHHTNRKVQDAPAHVEYLHQGTDPIHANSHTHHSQIPHTDVHSLQQTELNNVHSSVKDTSAHTHAEHAHTHVHIDLPKHLIADPRKHENLVSETLPLPNHLIADPLKHDTELRAAHVHGPHEHGPHDHVQPSKNKIPVDKFVDSHTHIADLHVDGQTPSNHTLSQTKASQKEQSNRNWTEQMRRTTIDNFVTELTSRFKSHTNDATSKAQDAHIKVLPLSRETIIQVLQAIAGGEGTKPTLLSTSTKASKLTNTSNISRKISTPISTLTEEKRINKSTQAKIGKQKPPFTESAESKPLTAKKLKNSNKKSISKSLKKQTDSIKENNKIRQHRKLSPKPYKREKIQSGSAMTNKVPKHLLDMNDALTHVKPRKSLKSTIERKTISTLEIRPVKDSPNTLKTYYKADLYSEQQQTKYNIVEENKHTINKNQNRRKTKSFYEGENKARRPGLVKSSSSSSRKSSELQDRRIPSFRNSKFVDRKRQISSSRNSKFKAYKPVKSVEERVTQKKHSLPELRKKSGSKDRKRFQPAGIKPLQRKETINRPDNTLNDNVGKTRGNSRSRSGTNKSSENVSNRSDARTNSAKRITNRNKSHSKTRSSNQVRSSNGRSRSQANSAKDRLSNKLRPRSGVASEVLTNSQLNSRGRVPSLKDLLPSTKSPSGKLIKSKTQSRSKSTSKTRATSRSRSKKNRESKIRSNSRTRLRINNESNGRVNGRTRSRTNGLRRSRGRSRMGMNVIEEIVDNGNARERPNRNHPRQIPRRPLPRQHDNILPHSEIDPIWVYEPPIEPQLQMVRGFRDPFSPSQALFHDGLPHDEIRKITRPRSRDRFSSNRRQSNRRSQRPSSREIEPESNRRVRPRTSRTRPLSSRSNSQSRRLPSPSSSIRTLNTRTRPNSRVRSRAQSNSSVQSNSRARSSSRAQLNSRVRSNSRAQSNSRVPSNSRLLSNSRAQTNSRTQSNSRTRSNSRARSNSRRQPKISMPSRLETRQTFRDRFSDSGSISDGHIIRGLDPIQRITPHRASTEGGRVMFIGSPSEAEKVVTVPQQSRGKAVLKQMRQMITQSEHRSAARGDPRRRIVVLPLTRDTVSRIFGDIGHARR